MTQAAAAHENAQKQLSSERRESLDVYRIMSLMPLRPYMTVANIGSGTGTFAIPLAKFLWDGKVYALDLDDGALEALKKRVAEMRLGNLVTLKTDGVTLGLEANSMDGVLLSWVLNQVPDKAAFLKQTAAVLRRTGCCAVVEWRTDAKDADAPAADKRIAPDEVARLGTEAGLRVTLRREISEQYYLLVLMK